MNHLKNTLYYNLFFTKPNCHFNMIKNIKNSYAETFIVKGFKGEFMWFKENLNESYVIQLKKDNHYSILMEVNDIFYNNKKYIINTNHSIFVNDNIVTKFKIKDEVISILKEKNDSHIISYSHFNDSYFL